MKCEDCGEEAFRCNYCEGKVCWCETTGACHESDTAVCADCDSKNTKSWGSYLRGLRMKFYGLVEWFPRPFSCTEAR